MTCFAHFRLYNLDQSIVIPEPKWERLLAQIFGYEGLTPLLEICHKNLFAELYPIHQSLDKVLVVEAFKPAYKLHFLVHIPQMVPM